MPKKSVLVCTLLLATVLLVGCAGTSNGPAGSNGDDGLHTIVPDVVGTSVDVARDTLEQAGFAVGEIFPEDADGIVVEQDPPAGYSAPQGETIDLTVTEDE